MSVLSDWYFEDELEEVVIHNLASSSALTVDAVFSHGNDELFSDAANASEFNLLVSTEDVEQVNRNDIVERPNGDRYIIRTLEPSCGDGALTVLGLARE